MDIITAVVVILGLLVFGGLGMFIVRATPHHEFHFKVWCFEFGKKQSPPLIHNTETAVGSQLKDLTISVESGRKAIQNDAPKTSMQKISAFEFPCHQKKQMTSEKNVRLRGGYLDIKKGAHANMNGISLEVSTLTNESPSTTLTDSVISSPDKH